MGRASLELVGVAEAEVARVAAGSLELVEGGLPLLELEAMVVLPLLEAETRARGNRGSEAADVGRASLELVEGELTLLDLQAMVALLLLPGGRGEAVEAAEVAVGSLELVEVAEAEVAR